MLLALVLNTVVVGGTHTLCACEWPINHRSKLIIPLALMLGYMS